MAILRLLALFGFSALCVCNGEQLEVVYQWSLVDFDTPYNYPVNKDYRGDQTVINSVEVGYDRVFLTLPRIWSGNPATVAWVPRNRDGYPANPSPVLQPFPSWDWHVNAAGGNPTRDNCSGIVSVFRTRMDKCNRLWVLDSGVMDSLVTFTVACRPKILIFDLNNDQLLRTITLPPDVTRPNTLVTNLVLDDQTAGFAGGPGACDSMFVYISDSTNPGLIVYDYARDSTWRLQSPKFFPEPDWGTYRVAGESFTLMDGIIGMTLSPSTSYRKTLYVQAFASDRLYSIPVTALQRGPNPGDDGDLPVSLVGHKSSQAAGMATSADGSLVFSPVSETAIASWLPGSPNHKVVAYSPELLQMVLDFRTAELTDNGNIWLVSSRFQKFFRRTVNPQEINLRVMRLLPDRPVYPGVPGVPNALPPVPASVPQNPPIVPGFRFQNTSSISVPSPFNYNVNPVYPYA
ncbi:Major royal jelly protein [Nesidiocoris tenuis]|uniref:Major royal jelly protein n=1 Tax=Nesidiocoris tenuis TaxID=355587 RepID=A0ABN7B828_9HEMI|nr:Major royal jelly protein [Nesidiocoris tenuis]